MNISELQESTNFQSSIQSREEGPPPLQDEVLYEEDEKLKFSERLKHPKWQIRKKAYIEIAEHLEQKDIPFNKDEETFTAENLAPILQNIIYEQNLIALTEGLRGVNAFFSACYLSRSFLPAFTIGLLDKLTVTRTQVHVIVSSILDKLIELDDISCIPNEILKRINNKNHKFVDAIMNILLKFFQKNQHIEDNIIRQGFTMILPMIAHSNRAIRKTAFEILHELYKYIEETSEELQNITFDNFELRSYHLKELKDLKKVTKLNNRKLVKLNDGSIKLHDNNKKMQNTDVKIELGTLMPEKYLEIPYMVSGHGDKQQFSQYQQNEKKKKLEEFNCNIEKTMKQGCQIECTKDYSLVINLMVLMLEDKNILINQEAIRTVGHLIKLLNIKFPNSKLKHILSLIIDKLNIKKKTNYNTQLLDILDNCIIYKAMIIEGLIDILLTNAENNKNFNVRASCLHWFSHSFISFLTHKRDILMRLFDENLNDKQNLAASSISTSTKNFKAVAIQNMKPDERLPKLISLVQKKVQQIQAKDIHNLTIKKGCQDVLDKINAILNPSQSNQLRESHPEMMPINENDISSIKNSKIVNISSITIPQMDSLCQEKLIDIYEDGQQNNKSSQKKNMDNNNNNNNAMLSTQRQFQQGEDQTVSEVRISRFNDSKRSEFSFENLKNEDKESFRSIMILLNDLKPNDESNPERLESVLTLIEKSNPEMIQASQCEILKILKKIVFNIASTGKNLTTFFELICSVIIKLNRSCLELQNYTLKAELKVIILFLSNILQTKQVEKILESAYMTCSIDKFLVEILSLFPKIDEKYSKYINTDRLQNSIRIVANWLAVKVDKLQNIMIDESHFRSIEREFSSFRFTNLPQVHLGVSSILTRKIRKLEESQQSALDSSVRSYETPRSRRYTKPVSVEPQVQGNSHLEEINDIEQHHFSQKLRNVQNDMKMDLMSGIEKFNTLLSSIKKKNLERSMVQGCLSPQSFLSPSRHWKRGLGREATPPLKKFSVRGSMILGGPKDASVNNNNNNNNSKGPNMSDYSNQRQQAVAMDEDKAKSILSVNIDEVLILVENMSSKISENELDNFNEVIQKLKTVCQQKDLNILFKVLLNSFLAKDCFEERLSRDGILKSLLNFIDGQERGTIFKCLKEFFGLAMKNQHKSIIYNCAKIGLDLCRDLYSNQEFPKKNVSCIVELIVYCLSEAELKADAEALLIKILKSISREELRKIFELELINSFKLYQVFLYWLDSEELPLPSPQKLQTQEDLEEDEILKTDILIEDHDDHPNLRGSFSKTPERIEAAMIKASTNKKPFKTNFAEVFQETNNHNDLKRLAMTLMADEKNNDDLEIIKAKENEEDKFQPAQLYQFKASVNSEFGFSELTAPMDASSNQRQDENNTRLSANDLLLKGGRRVLAERENIHVEVNELSSKSQSSISNQTNQENLDQSNKENLDFINNPKMQASTSMTKDRYQQQLDHGSAEKWKSKYIQEKEKHQATIEILEKANEGYLNQVSDRKGVIDQLNQQRSVNEKLVDKFNMVIKENEVLKQNIKTIESEKQTLTVIPQDSKFLKNRIIQNKEIKDQLALMTKTSDSETYLKQMQEILLTSNNLELEMGDALIKSYENTLEYGEKLFFVLNLKKSVIHPQVLENLSVQNQKFLLELALKLCISENTQKEIVLGDDGVTFVETQLTTEMQLLLDGLLRFHSVNATLTNLIRILSECIPESFNAELAKGEKMMLKLTVKCLVRLSGNFRNLVGEDVRVFDVLLEIYKLFKLHPPETLNESQPNIKDYDSIFRNVKSLADNVIDLQPTKAKEFSSFFMKDNSRNIFVDYVKSYTEKYYPNLTSSVQSYQ